MASTPIPKIRELRVRPVCVPMQRLRVLDDEGLTWVEEPTLAHDYVGHARVTREAETPIQCGENWWGTLDMQHAIDAQQKGSDLRLAFNRLIFNLLNVHSQFSVFTYSVVCS
jgi:hypothetical protein